MSHWPFVIASYALAVLGTAGVAGLSFVAMRRAEAGAEALRRER